ncbi:hypothetical protein Tco_1023497 [Tanacetum coccineum]
MSAKARIKAHEKENDIRANPQATIVSKEQLVSHANRYVIKKNNQRVASDSAITDNMLRFQSIPAESDSLPHAHIQDLMTYIWHQDSRIKKAKIHAKIKTSVNSNIQDLPYRYQEFQDKDCKGRLLASFQDDAKYEHVGQETRSQDGEVDKDKQGERFKDLRLKTKSKDDDKGSILIRTCKSGVQSISQSEFCLFLYSLLNFVIMNTIAIRG